jgi:translation initiation factor IF-2
MSGLTQLIKVVRELNVGAETLAEALKHKGHIIDAKPTTKITQEQYDILMESFKGEKKIKDEAQQLKTDKPKNIQIIADEVPRQRANKFEDEEEQILIKNASNIKEKPAEKTKAPEIETNSEEPVKKVSKTKKETLEKVEQPIVEEKKESVVLEADGNQDSQVKVQLKIAGKINLSEVPIDSNRPDRKSKDKKKEPSKVEPEKPKQKATKEEIKTEVKEHKKKATEKPAEPIAEEPKPKSKELLKEEKQDKQPLKVETPPTPIPTDEINKEVITPNYQTLGGFKVMGKIELPTNPVPDKKDSAEKRKRKRKAIGEKVSIPQVDRGASRSTDNRVKPQGGGAPGAPRGPYQGGGQRNDRYKPAPKAEISDKEIQDKLKETLARIAPGSRKPSLGDVRSKFRKQKRGLMSDRREDALAEEELQSKVLKVTEFVSASELAKMMNVQVTQIIQACFTLGMMVSINQRLDAETISIVADSFGYSVDFVSADAQEELEQEEDLEEDLIPRPPIVTIMGHVDHGKTSLLDYIRNANVVAGEAGGITQHIGAYEVTLKNGKQITFLDTPGHEAFTAMRARGAKITDVVIIVVAADDSVMPQTKEAISHSQAAGVPIIFAINKMDKDGANSERIREQLSQMNILVEDWGGKFQSQEISAKKGLNIDLLLEKVLLEAELLDLKANPNKRAVGSVIEATLDKGRGIVTTVMIQSGTLKTGDPILAGIYSGRVKAMFNERGQRIEKAGPSTPVSLLGFAGAPQAGDKFVVAESEHQAKEVSNKRSQLMREQGLRTHKHITLDEIGRRLAIGNFKELNLIVKGDVDGSIEALSDSLLKLSTDEIQINVVHKAVGQISETDVMLASASDAIIIGFNVRPSASARKVAENEDIDIRLYSIIYNAIEEVKSAMEGMLSPKVEEKIVCNVAIRDVFKVDKVGTVAGCYVMDGKINRNTKIRIIRDGVVIHTGELSSLKRFKDDVKEVASNYECGLSINKFNDIIIGDFIEGYEMVETKRKL